MGMGKKIALISTGGTISMKAAEDNMAVPTAGAEELTRGIDESETVKVDSFDAVKKPGAHLTFDDLVVLKEMTEEKLAEGYDGVIITHGTDTLEETSYFLDLTLDTEKPVVVTGAQKNLSDPQTDALNNINASIMVAADSRNRDMGVEVVFANEILAARDAIKTHSSAFNTFKSYGSMGTLGYVVNNRVIWHRRPFRKEFIGLENRERDYRVEIVECYLGADTLFLDACIENNVDGIVLQTVGAGHVPEKMLPALEKAVEKEIPVVITKRPLGGGLFVDTYGFVGSESYLRKMGLTFAEDLPSSKARIKLKVLLSHEKGNTYIKEQFEKDYFK